MENRLSAVGGGCDRQWRGGGGCVWWRRSWGLAVLFCFAALAALLCGAAPNEPYYKVPLKTDRAQPDPQTYIEVKSGTLCVLRYDSQSTKWHCAAEIPLTPRQDLPRGKMLAIVPDRKNSFIARIRWRRRNLPRVADAAIGVVGATGDVKVDHNVLSNLFSQPVTTFTDQDTGARCFISRKPFLGKIDPSFSETSIAYFTMEASHRDPRGSVVRDSTFDAMLTIPLQPNKDMPVLYSISISDRKLKPLSELGFDEASRSPRILPEDKGLAVLIIPPDTKKQRGAARKGDAAPYVVKFVKLNPEKLQPNMVAAILVRLNAHPNTRYSATAKVEMSRSDGFPREVREKVPENAMEELKDFSGEERKPKGHDDDAEREQGRVSPAAGLATNVPVRKVRSGSVGSRISRHNLKSGDNNAIIWQPENDLQPAAERKVSEMNLGKVVELAWEIPDDLWASRQWSTIASKLKQLGFQKVVVQFENGVVPTGDFGLLQPKSLEPSKDFVEFAKAVKTSGAEMWILSTGRTIPAKTDDEVLGKQVTVPAHVPGVGFPSMWKVGNADWSQFAEIAVHAPSRFTKWEQYQYDGQVPSGTALIGRAVANMLLGGAGSPPDELPTTSKPLDKSLPVFNVMCDLPQSTSTAQKFVQGLEKIAQSGSSAVPNSQVLFFTSNKDAAGQAAMENFIGLQMKGGVFDADQIQN